MLSRSWLVIILSARCEGASLGPAGGSFKDHSGSEYVLVLVMWRDHSAEGQGVALGPGGGSIVEGGSGVVSIFLQHVNIDKLRTFGPYGGRHTLQYTLPSDEGERCCLVLS
jgi:hypothetical protein